MLLEESKNAVCVCKLKELLFNLPLPKFFLQNYIIIIIIITIIITCHSLSAITTATQRVSFLGTDEEEEVRRLYGSGFAMKLATERRMANEIGGSIGGGIPSSSNMMNDILSGRDQSIGFEDTLGLPEYRPLFNKAQEDPHLSMERQLKM